jgi:hypothetical protein
MKKTVAKLVGLYLLISAFMTRAETLFSPGSITIGTNQAILITSMNDAIDLILLDGQYVFFRYDYTDPQFAIAGNHTLSFVNGSDFITYQLFNNCAIKTMMFTNTTEIGVVSNSIYVPSGKTIQFFTPMTAAPPIVTIVPDGSTNIYNLSLPGPYRFPAVAGPATIQIACNLEGAADVVSYYFTDEILQIPPKGFLNIPAPAMEIDIQKSYDLTNWTNTGAFGTSAEGKAFYRLQILQ